MKLNDMSRFKIGQKVVAIKDHSQGVFKKGDEFIVDGFTCCPSCGNPCIYLNGKTEVVKWHCRPMGCGANYILRESFSEFMFAPLQNNADAIEYKISVSIPELITIKEYQNQ